MRGVETTNALLSAARAWRDDDPDPVTVAELDALITRAEAGDDAATADLADRFTGLLQFGTAGLRGALGAGPNRMNRAVVIRAAAGLAGYLTAHVPAPQTPRVVVGFDARHNSDTFAADTCAVMAGAGVEALVLPRPLPTPVLAFAVRHLGADAGVMVTASHNPPQDNGYKVYLGGRLTPPEGNGVQIVPPADAQIAAAIDAVTAVRDVVRADDGWSTLGEDLLDTYLDHAASVVAPDSPRDLSIVLTPLHGVGGDTAVRALTAAGFTAPYVVPQQAEPDPDFPTVSFPNPEEPGAIDLALAAAVARGADLVIANDPDADRCAVAVLDPAGNPAQSGPKQPAWRMLRGDELGALLGSHLIARGLPETADGLPVVMACSIVSSELLSKIAARAGIAHAETLTGFKWIARVPGLVFGYEEALGYCVAPYLVRDKDGITTALLIAELAATLKAAGRTLIDELDALAVRYGVHATDQLAVRVDDLALIDAAMARLRENPPITLAEQRVVSVEDLAQPTTGLPPTDGLRYRTDGGIRVVVRPSGTEPKLKCYLEAVVPVSYGIIGVPGARSLAGRRLAQTRSDLQAALGL
ncbi:MAG: phospho-sugar mutase [Kineosporiaceae bacterium]|nr:phospho-sugar mutase [Kineosporiaceae bacterium]